MRIKTVYILYIIRTVPVIFYKKYTRIYIYIYTNPEGCRNIFKYAMHVHFLLRLNFNFVLFSPFFPSLHLKQMMA